MYLSTKYHEIIKFLSHLPFNLGKNLLVKSAYCWAAYVHDFGAFLKRFMLPPEIEQLLFVWSEVADCVKIIQLWVGKIAYFQQSITSRPVVYRNLLTRVPGIPIKTAIDTDHMAVNV